jgi:hypothetical protein
MHGEDRIRLSVILRIVGGNSFVRRNITCLLPQIEGRSIEVIVPYDSTVSGMDDLVGTFPRVRFLQMGYVKTQASPETHAAAHELYDRRTAAGLKVARGEILALLEDYGLPEPDWCDQILDAHKLPYGVIGGSVEHRGAGLLNWAIYFIDFGRYQLPLVEGLVDYLSDVNVSYKRRVLESVSDAWTREYNEVAVHWALAKKGEVLWQRPQIVVGEDRGHLSFMDAIRERFWWGRLFGSIRAQHAPPPARFLYVFLSPIIPLVLFLRMTKKIIGTRRNWYQFLLASPLIAVLTAIWSAGELIGYISKRASPRL